MQMVVKVTDKDLIENLLHVEIDFDNPDVREIYEHFKKLTHDQQIAVFKRTTKESAALRDLALVVYPTKEEDEIIIEFQ